MKGVHIAVLVASLGLVSALPAAWGTTFELAAEDTRVVGDVRVVEASHEDTLVDIARRHNVGFNEIRRANPGVDVWMPGAGTRVLIPQRFVLPNAPREGIVINLPEKRLYYYPEPQDGEPQKVITYPVSIGRMDWGTPLGLSKVEAKAAQPTWYPPQSVRQSYAERGEDLPSVVPPGPDNPLGDYAIRLSIPGYLIHGTNKPSGIGMRVTHGCIRLYPEDIEELYQMVDRGTPVRMVNQPHKAGWRNGRIYMESHPPLSEDADEAGGNLTPVVRAVSHALSHRQQPIDWNEVMEIATRGDGVPIRLSQPPEERALDATAPMTSRSTHPGPGWEPIH